MTARTLCILHLEDDFALKETVGELFSVIEPNSEIVQFTNSDDALKFIDAEGHRIDLYLLDVRVPGRMDGLGVAHHVRSRNAQQPIIFMSAFQKPAESELSALRPLEWIKKPWSVDKLLEVLERVRS